MMAWSLSDDAGTIVGAVGDQGDVQVVWHCR
jgi:hypothetical protein